MREYRTVLVARPRGSRWRTYLMRLYLGMYAASMLAEKHGIRLNDRFTRLLSWLQRRYGMN